MWGTQHNPGQYTGRYILGITAAFWSHRSKKSTPLFLVCSSQRLGHDNHEREPQHGRHRIHSGLGHRLDAHAGGVVVVLDMSSQSRRHPLSERGADLYQTPAVAVHSLLREQPLPRYLWEPAAGRGAIVNTLRDAGHVVLASDLVDYNQPSHFAGRDFLLERKAPYGCEAIVTNPPFKLATEFVEHALNLVPLVVMLLRLAFMESVRRTNILENRGLERVLVYRRRLPMMHRDNYTGPKANSGMAFAWFVWNRDYAGPTELRRISWEN